MKVRVSGFGGWFLLRLSLHDPVLPLNIEAPTKDDAVKLGLAVQQAMQCIDETSDVEAKTELIKTLKSVSVGKIYVEIERARLIKILAKIKEQQGTIAKAADLMQEIAVENFGAMAKTEKIAFILEQWIFGHASTSQD